MFGLYKALLVLCILSSLVSLNVEDSNLKNNFHKIIFQKDKHDFCSKNLMKLEYSGKVCCIGTTIN